MKKILVVGANGQLGKCLQKLSSDYDWSYNFIFLASGDLDITDAGAVLSVLEEEKPHFCINAAAYTAVDLAEQEAAQAFAVNADGPGNLAQACREVGAVLIHISTDYVFDGDTEISYDEDNFTNPNGIYGASKLKGEQLVMESNPKSVIIRTSWLYSEYNKNFVKTMLHLFSEREEIGVENDQFGQPTNANDLAEAIMQIIESDKRVYGVFHFSNYGETTWFHFARKIAELSGSDIKIKALTTAEYPTPAARPRRSTLALDRIESAYGIEPRYWENSLQECLQTIMVSK